MAELIQLDKAAALAGKSEVTLRRLIKAQKIPFQKEKTLTGFIYLVDPEEVRKFYNIKVDSAPKSTEELPKSPSSQSGVRIAVAGDSGNANEYWQKKSELYEDRYQQELIKHSNTREELGVWRGRAEQTQSMLMKLLPAPGDVEVQRPQVQHVEARPFWTWTTFFLMTVFVIVLASAVGYMYFTGLR